MIHAGTLVAVFALAAAYGLPIAFSGINPFDEGIRLYGGDRVLAGERPYRDFFAYYGPGQYYWPALLFRLMDTQWYVFRLGALAMVALAAASLFALARNAGLTIAWALASVVGLLLPITMGHALFLCDPALALALAGGAVATAGVRAGRGRLFVAGLVFGVGAAFRPDFGVAGLIAGTIAACVTRSARALGFLMIGFASVVALAYGVFAIDGPYRLVHSLFGFPPTVLPYRLLPWLDYPRRLYWSLHSNVASGAWLNVPAIAVRIAGLLAVPAFLAGVLVAVVVPSLRSRVMATPARAATVVFIVALLPVLAGYALIRLDFSHAFPMSAVCAAGLAIVVASTLDTPRMAGRAVVACAVGVALAGMLCVNILRIADYVPLGGPRAALIRVARPQIAYADAAMDIVASDRGRILVACDRHDRILLNPVILYFLSGRASGTYFSDFPHVTATRETQERIVHDLRAHDVRTVVAWRCPESEEPNLSSRVRGATVLDDFLRAEFVVREQRPQYAILVRSSPAGGLRRE